MITVSWAAPPARSTNDWVGLFRIGDSHRDHGGRWQYTGGTERGMRGFAAPTVPGQYEFRYFLKDGYTESVATSNLVSVRVP